MSSDFVVQVGLAQLQLIKGDITQIAVDAIVNAANSELAGGGGVDGAIHEAGGPSIMGELALIRSQIGRCPPGSAVVTAAGALPAKFIFHAVGPVYRDGKHEESERLKSCYVTCLDLAAAHGAESISFPSISTGVYRYPAEEAADIALGAVTGWLRQHSGSVRIVKLVQFSDRDHEIYRRHAHQLNGEHAAGSRH